MRLPEEDWSSRGKGRRRDLGTEHAAFPGSRDRGGERGGRGLGSSGRGRVGGALGWEVNSKGFWEINVFT